MADIIKSRRDTAENWRTANPTLAEGELGFETDTKRYKLGDGKKAWNDLDYFDRDVDEEPTVGSNNLVTSGDVFNNKSVVFLSVIGYSGVTGQLHSGEYGYNVTENKLYYKTTDSDYKEIGLKRNTLYIHNTTIYILGQNDKLEEYVDISNVDKLINEFGISSHVTEYAVNYPYDAKEGEYYLFYNAEDFAVNIYVRVSEGSENITVKTSVPKKSYYLYKAEKDTSYVRAGGEKACENGVYVWGPDSVFTKIEVLKNEKDSGNTETNVLSDKIDEVQNIVFDKLEIKETETRNIPYRMYSGKTYFVKNTGNNVLNVYVRTEENSPNIIVKEQLFPGIIHEYKSENDTYYLRIGSSSEGINLEIYCKDGIQSQIDELKNALVKDEPENDNNKVIVLSYIKGAGVTSALKVGEYGYNTYTKLVYYKDTETTYKEFAPSKNTMYVYRKSFYIWNGKDLVTKHFTEFEPKVTFNVGHEFKAVDEEFNSFDLTPEGRKKTLEQVYKKFDELATAYPELVTKYDPMASSDISSSDGQHPDIKSLPEVLSNMKYNGFEDYPFYANGIGSSGEKTFNYPNGVNISRNYDVTPRYRTYIYRINYNNAIVNRERATKEVMFLTGGVHPNETVQPYNLYILAKEICESTDIELFKLACIYDIWIMPCVDGYGIYHDTRCNANGVNINRNFDNDWESGTEGENYGGPYAGSEFETQLLMSCYRHINPSAVIDCHNYSALNAQFYTISRNAAVTDNAYKSLIDCSKTFIKELPDYFGNSIRLFVDGILGDGHAPMRVSGYKGSWSDWCDANGAVGAETVEVSQCINYRGGKVNTGYESFTLNVFKIAEYTLRIQLLRLAEFCLKHKPVVID